MAVQIDPRVMKQMLQLQMTSQTGLLQGSSLGDSDNATSVFSMLLNQWMEQSSAASPSEPNTADATVRPNVNAPVAAFSPAAWSIHPGISKPSSYELLIEEAGQKHGVDPSLIKGVISTESAFNPYAKSSAGAKGLMQLMDGTARGLGVTDAFDPQQNIEGGTRFLADLLGKYGGSEAVALAAYNAGPGRIDRLGITDEASLRAKLGQLPKETQAYIGKVLDAKQTYKS